MPDGVQTGSASGFATYALSSWLFLRLLGLIYLAAFVSLATQIKGLAGRQGVLPTADFLRSRLHLGIHRFYLSPTLCWLNSSDRFLLFLSWGGALLALLLVLGFAPLPVLVLLWAFYLSLFGACRLFLSYQWDVLLLETGFLAIFLAPLELRPAFPPATAPSILIVWLFWWLLFRLMFSSGLVKLRSGDPTWRNLTALSRHYETQPLPTPLAWDAHQMPVRFHQASAALMFAIELGTPFLIPCPGLRRLAACAFILLMVLIELTGNYCFFNLLGIALSLLLLDDQVLLPVFRELCPALSRTVSLAPAPASCHCLCFVVALLVLGLSLEPVLRLFRLEMDWPRPVAKVLSLLAPLQLVNSYGLFSLMTTERPEIIIEGSEDGVNWRPYEFKWKPGDVKRPPRFVAPHQPRLDWQMWFAALDCYEKHPWLACFLNRLLEGSSAVLSLLRKNPFPQAPPRYIRGVLYDYRFTTRVERRATGACWRRERRGFYSPAFNLDGATRPPDSRQG
ncbi:MAG TPA: lipase maturation factor family protein [Candidatus Binatia bacterium]|jgi:hypothetical protein|nr:lipase maturation factor family protein [Candidatus Binatia bacterium]